jgi:hypothetical protein
VTVLTVATWLARLGAHRDVVDWAEPFGMEWERAWAECPRGDWLLGIAARTAVEPSALVRAACACARLAQDYVPDEAGLGVLDRALADAESWAGRRGPIGPLTALADELERAAEGAPYPAAASALLAASAATRAAATPEAAASAASLAVEAAVLAAGECGMMSALGFMQRKTADAVRTHVPRQLVRGPLGRR